MVGAAHPMRIQLSRAKGWRLPANAMKVDRSTAWGNPFVVGEPSGVFAEGHGLHGKAEVIVPALTLEQCLKFYRYLIDGYQIPEMVPHAGAWSKRFHQRWGQHPTEVTRSVLRGKTVACWCPIAAPCHADILLEIANA